jgi:hypothetical protein
MPVLVADRRGSGFLNRDRQVRLLPGTLLIRICVCLVTRLESRPHCPWDADRFDPGTRRDLGCRVMVTGRASKTRREGSIPSWPAEPETFDDDHFFYLLNFFLGR